MGAGISNWRLARAVARRGQLGVVSGVGLDTLLVRRIEDGDPGGYMRQAAAQFPLRHALDRRWHATCALGTASERASTMLPDVQGHDSSAARQQLTMLAAFVEVWLAKAGHDGLVGINLLTKIQPPNLATLYGAMLAGVDYVLMGAGIPREIPGALDRLARHQKRRCGTRSAACRPARRRRCCALLRASTGSAFRHRSGGPSSCRSSPAPCWPRCWCAKPPAGWTAW